SSAKGGTNRPMQFRILGPLEVLADDGTRVVIGGAKPRALLATLVARPNEAVSVDRLVDELWGEEPPETVTSALQVHVSTLRQALGADAVVRRGAGYAVVVDGEAVDLVRFERLAAEARRLPPAGAAARLQEALALWRGEP